MFTKLRYKIFIAVLGFFVLIPTQTVAAKAQLLYKPTTFTAQSKAGGILLNWSRSKTSDVTGYVLYRSEKKSQRGVKIKTTPAHFSYWLDTAVKPGRKYYYTLQAIRGRSFSFAVYANSSYIIPKDLANVAPNMSTRAPVVTQTPIAQPDQTKVKITTDVVVDTAFFTISDAEINQLIQTANERFSDKMHAMFQLRNIKRLNYDVIAKASRLSGNAGATLLSIYGTESYPNYMVVLTKDEVASTFGGYAAHFPAENYCNPFKSVEGQKVVLAAVLDWNHMYAQCGYTQEGIYKTITSSVSANGECRGTPNTACIMHPSFGYQMCKDVYEDPTWYALDRRNMLAASIVHEFLHHFGDNGNDDHFGSPTCDKMTGGVKYWQGGLNDMLETTQQYAVMCPIVFERIKTSYVGCAN